MRVFIFVLVCVCQVLELRVRWSSCPGTKERHGEGVVFAYVAELRTRHTYTHTPLLHRALVL